MISIPTNSRSRISRKLGYPLGAELISEALQGVSQYEQIKLHFTAGWSSNFEQDLKRHLSDRRPLRILYVTYANTPPGLSASNASIEAGYFNQRWELWVEAVPVESKAAIRELLQSKALPRVKQWLSTPPLREDWGRGGRALDFFVVLPLMELTFAERRWD